MACAARASAWRATSAASTTASTRLLEQAIEALRAQGAIIVDTVEVKAGKQLDDAELTVLHYEFKDGLNAYLATRTMRRRRSPTSSRSTKRKARARCRTSGRKYSSISQAKGPLTAHEYRAPPPARNAWPARWASTRR